MNERPPSSEKISGAVLCDSAVTKPSCDFVTNGSDGRGASNGVSKDIRHIGRQRKHPHPDSAKSIPSQPNYEHRKWLNSKQAAEYLGTTVGNIRNLVWKRKLPAYKPLGKLLFDRAHLDRIIMNAKIW